MQPTTKKWNQAPLNRTEHYTERRGERIIIVQREKDNKKSTNQNKTNEKETLEPRSRRHWSGGGTSPPPA